MTTKNIYYSNRNDLESFIKLHDFSDEKSVLVQVFSSILEKEKLESVLSEILEFLPQSKIIGATSDGEILENKVTVDKIIISITSFKYATLKVAVEKLEGNNSFLCGSNLAKKLLEKDTKVLLLFTDGLHINGEVFLNGIKSVSDDTTLSGGMAGDGAKFDKTYILSNEGVFCDGAVGISINTQRLNVKTSYSFNWQEIGKELTITKAVDNRVYKIGELTAVETYAHYLGDEIASSLPAVGIEFPLVITRNKMKIARAVLGKEEDGSLIFAGNVNEGDKVHFGYGNSGMILGESSEIEKEFANDSVESIFIYSCMARRRFLEETITTELTPFAKIAPTTGFFTYGEFYKAESCELLNQTMTVLAMSEDDDTKEHYFESEIKDEDLVEMSVTQKALSHLIETTSKELKDTNENLEKLVHEKTSQLQDKIAELEEASKAKSNFLAGMSHEIRTPLNAMLGFVDILKSGETDKIKKGQLGIIKNSGISLLTIINDILDFSKIESGKMILEKRYFSTKTPFEESAMLFNELAKEKDIRLTMEYSDLIPLLYVGDTVRIKQVISNFFSNAIKFTPEGGSIAGKLDYMKESKELQFCVKDSGVGIDAKNLYKIFESFTQEDNTTTRKFGGTGLGLTISKSLVSCMEGKITVKSELSHGSEFCFTIPLLEAESSEEQELSYSNAIDLEMPLSGKILVVEDNKTNQMLIKILLNDLSLDVCIAEDGLEAVSMFQERKYDLILMDENMPKMNGIEATRIILNLEKEQNLEHTPIVALTANALSTDRARFLNAGMDEFISKPIDQEFLVRVLHRFLLKE